MLSLTAKRRAQDLKLRTLPPAEEDPHWYRTGVLLSDEIRFYVEHHHLITPFDPTNLKPAAYELTIGNEYFLNGEFRQLGHDDKYIRIPPFEVAVLKTAEILSMPRFLIARWNIKVRHAYSGLLWVGGPQVDPGYVGNLFCPIYNLSDKEVTLCIGDQIAVIDFVKTTPFDTTIVNKFPFPPSRMIIEDYGISELRSALFTVAGQKLVEFDNEIRNQTTRFTTFTQISFAMFALMIALIAIISRTNAENLSFSAGLWGAATIWAATFAVLVSIFSYVGGRVGRLVYEQYGRLMGGTAAKASGFLRRAWRTGIAISFLVSMGGGYVIYRLIEPGFQDLRQHHMLTKSDLAPMNDALHDLSVRLSQVELGRVATLDDLQRLKASLEEEIKKAKGAQK
jgi:deoxycytidine triphosphate deaminase